MLLILDLDETLLYASKEPLAQKADFCVGPFSVYLRPHLSTFLDYAAQHFSLAVWTSSSRSYGHAICRTLFPAPDALAFVWCQERCTRCFDHENLESYWVKDFKKLRRKGFDLTQTLVLDDTAQKHERNYGNLVPISPYEGQADDRELLWLCQYLEELRVTPNVRLIDKRAWQHHYATVSLIAL